jgi:hypothetical protein
MFSVLILICNVSLAPMDCQRETAVDIIQGPPAANEMQCALYGQAFYAETAMGRGMRPDEYLKVKCQRTTINGGTVG